MMMLELVSYATLFFLTALLLRSIFSFTNPSRSRLPPSPLALPIVGHFHLLGRFIHHSLHELSCRYGPLIHLRLGSVPCVVASTPELAKQLLQTHELTFSSRKHSKAIDHLTYNAAFAFAPYGPYWKFIKKLTTTELLRNHSLNSFLPIRTQEYHGFIRILMNKANGGETVNVTEELLKLANNIISQMMFGVRSSATEGQADEARHLVREVTQIFGEFNVPDFIWLCRNMDFKGFCKRFEGVHRRYDALLEKIISDREEERLKSKKDGGVRNVKDFLDILLDALEDENSEIKLTRNHIKSLILDFFTAATDTTAISIDWALAELINHPTVLKKAQAEIDEVVGNSRLVEESDGPNLPYIQAIIKETFRLHPPIPMISRKSVQDCKIDGYTIPANTLLFVNNWSMGRNPKYWENPMEFRPERFLPSGEGDLKSQPLDVKGQHFQLLPFGSGRRGCPGMPLAMLELPAILGAMIQCFEWDVVGPDGKKISGDNVVDMTERSGLTAPRAHDLVCVPVARFNPLKNLNA